VNMNTNPLLAFHPRTLASSETLGDSPQNLYQSIASSGGMNNKPKLLRNKVKSIIQTTEQSAAELKTVLTDMNTQQKARFSFARQRMDFHREPAKLAKVVGSGSANNKLHESYRDNRDTFGSHNNSLSQALQAKGAMRSSGIDQVREVRNVKSRNSPDQMRETGIREVQNGRSRNSPDQMRETGVRNMRSRNSPEQMRDNSAPVFGDVIRESREYRDDNNYESKRREKKERDNKTHESLLVLKDDIDRIKGDLQRSKSTTREPRRSNDRPTYRDGSPGLSSYQGLTRDAKNTRDDPYDNRRQPQYEQQKQSRNRMEPAENEYNQRQGGRYNQPPSINIPLQYNTAGPDMTQSQQYNRNMNPQQYPKKETFGKNDDPGRAMKFSQAQAQNPNNQYYENNGRPKSPLTADFAAYKRNDYEKQTMARSQTPVHDARGGNPPSYRDQGLAYSSPNLTPQNQNRIPQQVKKFGSNNNNNQYTSEPNYNSMNGEREQGLNYGQINVQKNRSDNYHSQPQPQTQPQPKNTVPNQYGHQNLLNLLTPQKNNNNKSQANNDMNFMNTPRSKHNFSGIVSDVNGSYSFDDDNEVQPVSINLNLEDLLNYSQIQINNGVPQKSNKNGYQQPSQANYSKVNHSSTRNDPPYPPHPNQNRFQNQNNYQQSQVYFLIFSNPLIFLE